MGRNAKFFSGSNKVVDGFIGGWRLAGTSIFQTGPPLTVEDSSVNLAIGQNTYPNRIANAVEKNGPGRRGVDYPWFNPGDYQPVPSCISRTNCSPDQYGFVPFADGNGGRNDMDGPGLANINLSLQKNWAVGERKSFQFRWEVFNIFNHPNFVLLDRNFNETGAGYLHLSRGHRQRRPANAIRAEVFVLAASALVALSLLPGFLCAPSLGSN